MAGEDYDEMPLDTPDDWGDLAAWRQAAGDADLDRLAGPFLTRDGMSDRLFVSPTEVQRLAADRLLLEVVTSDGVALYPEFQLEGDGTVTVTGLDRVLAAFDDSTESWMIATWFVTPDIDLWDRTPIGMLRIGETDRVVAAAEAIARAWAS